MATIVMDAFTFVERAIHCRINLRRSQVVRDDKFDVKLLLKQLSNAQIRGHDTKVCAFENKVRATESDVYELFLLVVA